MKKILSLTLAALLLVSMIPTAMAAENNWQGGTKVEYTAATNEQYTVTVPATLAPGAAGDVVASGTWGSNRKLIVTADKDVTLTNSINAADQKVLDVTFAGIELTGSNTESVSDTKQVAVANITDAIFGTWSGTFNYNVAMSDVAGGSTTEPSDPDTGDGEEANLITFTIDGDEYQAEDGMTWAEWVTWRKDTMNNYKWEIDTSAIDSLSQSHIVNGFTGGWVSLNDTLQLSTDTITSNTAYNTVRMITFDIDSIVYIAEEGMTWREWCNSEYDTLGLDIDSDNRVNIGVGMVENVTGDDEITRQQYHIVEM